MRVLAAMSGGVDSAVAAARAHDAGHDVTGVHLALSRNPQTYRTGARGCCTLEDSRDARRAADVIGIPFYVWDMAEQFHESVVDDFVNEYAAGRTPNPCLRCNEKIKFAAVLDRAVALGFDAVVTGHHARLGDDGLLRRSVDDGKDQSYVLAVLTGEQLSRAVFPLGDSTKAQVRAEAAARGLAVADKPDSHDICFIADGDTRGFLRDRLGATPGDIVDGRTGERLGTHDGAYAYTIGQRKGLDLRVPAADGRPRYVLSITPVTNTVTVGPREDLEVDVVTAERPIWHGSPTPVECEVQLRAHGEVVPAVVTVADGVLTARLAKPARGVAAGQAIVAYRVDRGSGDAVLGSATITAGTRSDALSSASALSDPASTSASASFAPASALSAPASASSAPASASSAPASAWSAPASPAPVALPASVASGSVASGSAASFLGAASSASPGEVSPASSAELSEAVR